MNQDKLLSLKMCFSHTNNRHWFGKVKIMIETNKSKDIRATRMCMPASLRKQVRCKICTSKAEPKPRPSDKNKF